MSLDRLQTYIEEMQSVARETADFVKGRTKETFLSDLILQRALAMNLLIIGEAAARVIEEHPEFAAEFSAVPWLKIRGMRNRIAHGYMNINLDTVWDTAQTAIPDLLNALHAIRHWRAQGE
ncbi:DUF86 domain-containing protein [Rhizobium sp. RAF36]|jgi:uncharacterized protein with HEPN domain|uniref:HepT-like ribonuclease domain-containing protein n=1 Tax=Rhizobium sp. RAF36 TaxID=3233055 RepID=UPI003F99148E